MQKVNREPLRQAETVNLDSSCDLPPGARATPGGFFWFWEKDAPLSTPNDGIVCR
jgi:hypothetical protein